MQTRREMLASSLAAAGLTALPVKLHEVRGDEIIAVFRHPGRLSEEAYKHIFACWNDLTKGTSLEGVKAIAPEEGMDLELVRKPEGMN